MKEAMRFFGAFLRNPRGVSSVVPTASWNVRSICETIPHDIRRVIVEYGPGTGVVADHLTKGQRLTRDSLLFLIEQDPVLAMALREKFERDDRVRVFTESAENVRSIVEGAETVDHVITSIPFSKIRNDILERIMENTHGVLKPGGELTAFQVSGKVKDVLRSHAGFDGMTTKRLLLNLPPLILARVKKTAENGVAHDAPGIVVA